MYYTAVKQFTFSNNSAMEPFLDLSERTNQLEYSAENKINCKPKWQYLQLILFIRSYIVNAYYQAAQCPNLMLWLHNIIKQPKLPFCDIDTRCKRNVIYMLYDVNPPEGFNLRRDVYIRLAVFVRNIQKKHERFCNLRLILPPWRRLYHWKSHHLSQDHLPWSEFFDIEGLTRFAPILDFPEFLQEISLYGLKSKPLVSVHKLLQLQHFKDMFESGGGANLLGSVLQTILTEFDEDETPKVIAILNAEIVLHDRWADRQFWQARRSMRFSYKLNEVAKQFRLQHFNSTDITDKVQRPPMWEYEHPSHSGQAVGGPYLAVHLRRADFLYGRETTTPTLKSAALQIKYYLQQLNLNTVFLATDATAFEIKNLKSYLSRIRVLRFTVDSITQKAFIKDGGIAIIDQLVCSYARFFVGTYESTFTYRIYEEREILGFPRHTTFNTFSRDKKSSKRLVYRSCSRENTMTIFVAIDRKQFVIDKHNKNNFYHNNNNSILLAIKSLILYIREPPMRSMENLKKLHLRRRPYNRFLFRIYTNLRAELCDTKQTNCIQILNIQILNALLKQIPNDRILN
uniref:GDP-fucose protein O-fucosyltransferase 2 n=1 Tax=Glossina brevipalpis TaxID=37001 RepID=A0A1A9WFX2_9MUSC